MDAFAGLRKRLSPIGNMHSRGDGGLVDQAVARARRGPDRRFLASAGDLDALAELGSSVKADAPPPRGPRVLVLSLRYMPDHLAYEAVIAQALRMRGADVHLLNCGGGMPICEVGWGRRAAPRPCDRCGVHTDRTLAASDLPYLRLADSLPWGADPTQAPAAVGDAAARQLASTSIPWFLRAADPALVPGSEDAAEDFEVSVRGVAAAAEKVLDTVRPEIVVMLNGMFAAERTVRSAAAARDIRVVTYEIAPRAGHLVFSHGRPAPEYDTDDVWSRWKDVPLTEQQERALDTQLAGRVSGTTSHERYFATTREDLQGLDVPPGARLISLFTNVSWDSACLGREVAYPSMLDWMAGAVRAMDGVDDAVLVIRIHPAEMRWQSRERAQDSLLARLGDLPPNVRVVAPDEPLSTYRLVQASDLVLTYTTTVGLESTVRGIRVAVAARTHYRGRGFTVDLDSHDDLVRAVRTSAGPLTSDEVTLARRYAYAFFFRIMLPFPAIRTTKGHVKAVPRRAAEVAPGADRHLDWIVDRILDGGDFAVPDELSLPAP